MTATANSRVIATVRWEHAAGLVWYPHVYYLATGEPVDGVTEQHRYGTQELAREAAEAIVAMLPEDSEVLWK